MYEWHGVDVFDVFIIAFLQVLQYCSNNGRKICYTFKQFDVIVIAALNPQQRVSGAGSGIALPTLSLHLPPCVGVYGWAFSRLDAWLSVYPKHRYNDDVNNNKNNK